MMRGKFKTKRSKAWSKYLSSKTRESLENLIRAYEPMVGYLTWAIWHNYPHVEYDDMNQAGMIGLYKGIAQFDPKRCPSPDAWISLKVKSAMWSAYKYNSEFKWFHGQDFPEYLDKKMPTDEDGETFLDMLMTTDGDDIDFRLAFESALDKLEPRDSMILRKIYEDDVEQKSLAVDLGISEVRLCQLHRRALKRIKPYLWGSLGPQKVAL